MRFGFTFKGIHSSRFGITMITKSRSLLPETKQYYYSALAADGSYDFTEAGGRKRAAFENRSFQIVMMVCAENILRLQERVNGICSWLMGKGELVFDDIPSSIWTARVANSVSFAPEKSGSKAVLNVIFEAEPFARAQFDTLTGPKLSDAISLDSGLPMELDGEFVFTAEKGSKSYSFETLNIGTWYIAPEVIIETDFSGITNLGVGCAGKRLDICGEIADKLIIDNEACVVSDGAGNSLIKYTSGEFFELIPGENIITVTANKKFKRAVTVSVRYTPRFLYTDAFKNIKEAQNA